MGRIERDSNCLGPGEIDNIWYNWTGLYQSLVTEGRIWDARDILSAYTSAFGARKTWRMFFGIDLYSQDFFNKFLDDWTLTVYDESTYLATFDILVNLVHSLISTLRSSQEVEIVSVAELCLDHATAFANIIKQKNPENIKSRTYIRWILAQ